MVVYLTTCEDESLPMGVYSTAEKAMKALREEYGEEIYFNEIALETWETTDRQHGIIGYVVDEEESAGYT